jgi:hypothetical protein
MNRGLRALALTICLVSTASAEENFAFIGVGTQTCALFAADYKTDPDRALLYFAWSQGFMSGFNIGLIASKELTKNLAAKTPEVQQLYLRNYCDQRPQATFVQGVLALFGSFPTSPPQSK